MVASEGWQLVTKLEMSTIFQLITSDTIAHAKNPPAFYVTASWRDLFKYG